MYNYMAEKTVLIVDDVPMVCSFVKSIIQSLGAKQKNVDICYTAEEAVGRISRKFYDIILCDYYLGEGRNGQNILEEGRTLGYISASTIFLMLTAEKTRTKVVSVIEHEPDAYIVKPFNKTIVKDYLERTITRRRDIDEINRAIVENNIDYALQLCDEKIRGAPQSSVEYFRIKANILMDAQRYTDARMIFDTFMARGELLWARAGNAKISYLSQDYPKAKELFKEIIEIPHAPLECYDMLADSLAALAEPQEAQRILEVAVTASPNQVQRRRNLAELALRNGDIEVASQNFRALIALSKDTIYKSHTDYINFARILIGQKKYAEAVTILKSVRQRFILDELCLLEVAILIARALLHDRNKLAASASFKEAKKLTATITADIEAGLVLELVELALVFSDMEYAKTAAETGIRRFLDDQTTLDKFHTLFQNAKQEQIYNDIMMIASNDITAINRRGVQLFEQGYYKEAVVMFEKASAEQPTDVVMALNAAQSLIVCMQKHGATAEMKNRAHDCLDRANQGRSNADDNRYEKLLEMLKKL